jgi:hypothetical protein
MPYPDNFSIARYDEAQGRDDDGRAEREFLSAQIDKHGWPLMEALNSACTGNAAVDALCYELGAALDKALTEIKRTGDL